MSIFKAVRLFSPHQVNAMKPDASVVDQLTAIPFVKSPVIEELNSELPLYMACAKDVDSSFCPLIWWKQNSNHLPAWSKEARKIFLIQPSSASVERVFSLLHFQ